MTSSIEVSTSTLQAPDEASGGGRIRQFPSNEVTFVGKGNAFNSKYIVIPKALENEVESFTDNVLLRGLDNTNATEGDAGFLPSKPGVLISVTGGAQDFYMHSSKLAQVFNRGLMRAAQNTYAWIVDGGLDAGVMQYVGKAIKDVAVADVPCIGIASHKMVIGSELLVEKGQDAVAAEYVANQPNTPMTCALNPNHTHFILVDSEVTQWGQEIVFRSNFEKYIREKFQIPVVLIVVNGGPGTLETVAQGAAKNFAVVVVQGSGRASDAVAALVTKAQAAKKANAEIVHTTSSLMAIRNDEVDVNPWLNLLKEAKGDQKKIASWTVYMDRILQNHEAITVFNADDEAAADMDIFVLRAVLSSPGKKLGLGEKLHMGVVWNRDDIISEILATEKGNDSSSFGTRRAINAAFELAIQLDRAKIFRILAENGAKKDSVNLKRLYYYKPVKPFFHRLPAYAQTRHIASGELATVNNLPIPLEPQQNREKTEYSRDSVRNRTFLKETFRQAGRPFQGYWPAFEKKFEAHGELDASASTRLKGKEGREKKERGKAAVSFTDILIWAIFVNKMELAKTIWQYTTLPVHSALLACQLYRYLANHCADKGGYEKNADWFEDEAIKVMDILAYADIKDVLVWKWSETGDKSALDIAQGANCKRFICHSHVQTLLDDTFYSDECGRMEPTVPTYRIWLSILLPPFIYLIYKRLETAPPDSNILYFYRLPIVKFWTNTFFYCAFLIVQAWVLCTLKEGDNYRVSEIILWIWVFSLIFDEVHQYIKDSEDYFKYLSNGMDDLLLALHLVYMVLRWSAQHSSGEQAHQLFLGSVNVLIVACIFSWGRVLNVFAISDNLGPLYFIIIRLFQDIFIWLFVFAIFAVSFQLGFISITQQAGLSPTTGYPDGTFPVAFFTIIGEYSYAADLLKGTPLGVALLAVYALIAQILLVNLLIAMMGDTYANVSENSETEWKFYRLELMMENQSTSFHPPPTNLIIVPLQLIAGRLTGKHQVDREMKPLVTGDSNLINNKSRSIDDKTLKIMRIAKDTVVDTEREEEDSSVQSIVTNVHDRLRTLANERENDRTFLDKKFKELETTLTTAANHAASTGGGGAVPGLALDKLHESLNTLQEANQVLVTQNQLALSLLQEQQAQHALLRQQVDTLQLGHASLLALLQAQAGPQDTQRMRSATQGVYATQELPAQSPSRRGTDVRGRRATDVSGIIEDEGQSSSGAIIHGGDE